MCCYQVTRKPIRIQISEKLCHSNRSEYDCGPYYNTSSIGTSRKITSINIKFSQHKSSSPAGFPLRNYMNQKQRCRRENKELSLKFWKSNIIFLETDVIILANLEKVWAPVEPQEKIFKTYSKIIVPLYPSTWDSNSNFLSATHKPFCSSPSSFN
jgi:hypothetical protein